MSGFNRIGKLFSEPIEGDSTRFGSTEKKRGPKSKSAEPTVEPSDSKAALELVKSFEHLRALLSAEIKKENLSKEELIHRLAHFELMAHLAEETHRLSHAKRGKSGGWGARAGYQNALDEADRCIKLIAKTGQKVTQKGLLNYMEVHTSVNTDLFRPTIIRVLREYNKSQLASKQT